MYVNTGNGTRAEWQVTRLDTDHDDTQNEGSLVGGVNIRLDIPVECLPFMRDKYVEFDMGAWIQDADPFLPYLRKTPFALISLKPDEWLVQLKQNVTLDFKHGLDLVFGESHREGGLLSKLASGATYVLPDLNTSLSNIALTDVDPTIPKWMCWNLAQWAIDTVNYWRTFLSHLMMIMVSRCNTTHSIWILDPRQDPHEIWAS